jgi:hypothetical protein
MDKKRPKGYLARETNGALVQKKTAKIAKDIPLVKPDINRNPYDYVRYVTLRIGQEFMKTGEIDLEKLPEIYEEIKKLNLILSINLHADEMSIVNIYMNLFELSFKKDMYNGVVSCIYAFYKLNKLRYTDLWRTLDGQQYIEQMPDYIHMQNLIEEKLKTKIRKNGDRLSLVDIELEMAAVRAINDIRKYDPNNAGYWFSLYNRDFIPHKDTLKVRDKPELKKYYKIYCDGAYYINEDYEIINIIDEIEQKDQMEKNRADNERRQEKYDNSIPGRLGKLAGNSLMKIPAIRDMVEDNEYYDRMEAQQKGDQPRSPKFTSTNDSKRIGGKSSGGNNSLPGSNNRSLGSGGSSNRQLPPGKKK